MLTDSWSWSIHHTVASQLTASYTVHTIHNYIFEFEIYSRYPLKIRQLVRSVIPKKNFLGYLYPILSSTYTYTTNTKMAVQLQLRQMVSLDLDLQSEVLKLRAELLQLKGGCNNVVEFGFGFGLGNKANFYGEGEIVSGGHFVICHFIRFCFTDCMYKYIS